MNVDQDLQAVGQFGSLPLSVKVCSYGGEPRTHAHDVHQIVLPISGVLQMVVEGHPGQSGAGYLAVVSQGKDHTFYSRGRTNQFLVLDVGPELAREVVEAINPSQLGTGIFESITFLPLESDISSASHLLRREIGNQNQGYTLLIETLARYLIGILLRRQFRYALDSRAPLPYMYSHAIGRRVIDYLQVHYAENLQMTDLADIAGVSTSHFQRCFKRQTGMTPVQYLNGLRVEEAKRLLCDTDLTIVDIALQVGYGSQSYFWRVFMKQVGATPTVFRMMAESD